MRHSARLLTTLVVLLALAGGVSARELLSDGTVTAHAFDGEWCGTDVYVELRAPDRAPFQDIDAGARRTLSIFGTVMPSLCPVAQRVHALGVAGSVAAWHAVLDVGSGTVTAVPGVLPPRLPIAERDRVRLVQRLLLQAGYDPGPIDGLMGQRTRSAVAAYQRDRGTSSATLTDPTLLFALSGYDRPLGMPAATAATSPGEAAPPHPAADAAGDVIALMGRQVVIGAPARQRLDRRTFGVLAPHLPATLTDPRDPPASAAEVLHEAEELAWIAQFTLEDAVRDRVQTLVDAGSPHPDAELEGGIVHALNNQTAATHPDLGPQGAALQALHDEHEALRRLVEGMRRTLGEPLEAPSFGHFTLPPIPPEVRGRYAALGFSLEDMHHTFRAVQAAYRSGDLALLTRTIRYPFRLLGDQRVEIASADELAAHEATIFSPSLRQVVAAQTFEELFVRDMGAMFGNGAVWLVPNCPYLCDLFALGTINVPDAVEGAGLVGRDPGADGTRPAGQALPADDGASEQPATAGGLERDYVGLVALRNGRALAVVDLQSGAEIGRVALDHLPQAVVGSGDGRRAFTLSNDTGTVMVVDLEELAVDATIDVAAVVSDAAENPDFIPEAVNFADMHTTNDGSVLYLAMDFQGVVRLDVASQSALLSTDVLGAVELYPPMVVLQPDGSRLFAAAMSEVVGLNAQTLEMEARYATPGQVMQSLWFDETGQSVIVRDIASFVRIDLDAFLVTDVLSSDYDADQSWNPRSGTDYVGGSGFVRLLIDGHGVQGLAGSARHEQVFAVSPDGMTIYDVFEINQRAAPIADSPALLALETPSLTFSARSPRFAPLSALDVSPDGRFLLTSIPTENRVLVLDASTLQVVHDLTLAPTPVVSRHAIVPRVQ